MTASVIWLPSGARSSMCSRSLIPCPRSAKLPWFTALWCQDCHDADDHNALQSTVEIDWKSYEKEVDPQVLKAFRDSFSCKMHMLLSFGNGCCSYNTQLLLCITSFAICAKMSVVNVTSYAAMDFPAYDASSLANEAEQKLSEIIKQVGQACSKTLAVMIS